MNLFCFNNTTAFQRLDLAFPESVFTCYRNTDTANSYVSIEMKGFVTVNEITLVLNMRKFHFGNLVIRLVSLILST